jgi:hypothetical protein
VKELPTLPMAFSNLFSNSLQKVSPFIAWTTAQVKHEMLPDGWVCACRADMYCSRILEGFGRGFVNAWFKSVRICWKRLVNQVGEYPV